MEYGGSTHAVSTFNSISLGGRFLFDERSGVACAAGSFCLRNRRFAGFFYVIGRLFEF
jgi:hypothetical protein